MHAENRWNWQQDDWPRFRFDKSALQQTEARFLLHGGVLLGALLHIRDDEKSALTAELLSNEAIKTSEIEGEYLNRDNIDSYVSNSLMLVTALSPVIGYQNAAHIAEQAAADGSTLREAALRSGKVSAEEYDKVIVPKDMIGKGVGGA